MKTLKESLLDDIDGQLEDQSALYMDWIKENYEVRGNLKYHNGVVDVDGDIYVKNRNITSLTNDGFFKFGHINGDFECSNCLKLKTFKDVPIEISGTFDCSQTLIQELPKFKKLGSLDCYRCIKLKSLKGLPTDFMEDSIDCCYCDNLVSLEGCPKKIEGNFYCQSCIKLKNLEGIPKYIGGDLNCNFCKNLTTLDGIPDYIGGEFSHQYCKKLNPRKPFSTSK